MIRKKLSFKVLITSLLFVSVVLLTGFGVGGKKNDNYVVLVSLDAFRWDYSKIYKTPNLDKLARDGVKADRMTASFPTNTFPNHYSIATGLYPDHHGIVNNTFQAPDLKLSYRIGDREAVGNGDFYLGEPVWVTAMKQGLRTASFFWVGSEAPVKGYHPDYWKVYDEKIAFGDRIDSVIKWLDYPESKRPRLVTLYFEEPDATSHDSGPVSDETGRVVARLDSLIGVLRLKISKLPISKQVNLIVLSDHGMSEVSSERYININDVLPRRFINNIWGGNPVYLLDPAAGKKDSVLQVLGRVRGLKAYPKENMPGRWHYGTNERIPAIVVVADSSWYVSLRPSRGSFKGGAHGYDNRNSDMHSIFYASGPAIRKGTKPVDLHNTDVYNIVCKILGIIPSENDGVMSHVEGILK
ncbi:MAG: ectonucleotide pyrophosphatase/phosphodiesterase [Bacteroidales bacterium]